jgi:hypothetical protein
VETALNVPSLQTNQKRRLEIYQKAFYKVEAESGFKHVRVRVVPWGLLQRGRLFLIPTEVKGGLPILRAHTQLIINAILYITLNFVVSLKGLPIKWIS